MIFICANCSDPFDYEDSPSEDYCVGCYTVGGVFDDEEVELL